jgi:hypothetical protein
MQNHSLTAFSRFSGGPQLVKNRTLLLIAPLSAAHPDRLDEKEGTDE